MARSQSFAAYPASSPAPASRSASDMITVPKTSG